MRLHSKGAMHTIGVRRPYFFWLREYSKETDMDNYKKVLSQWNNFDGRAGREEYWMFFLFNILIGFGIVVLSGIAGAVMDILGTLGTLVYFLYFLAIMMPSIAVGIRRLHDTGKTGWFMLIAFVPCIGGIALLVLLALPGDAAQNQYGPSPS